MTLGGVVARPICRMTSSTICLVKLVPVKSRDLHFTTWLYSGTPYLELQVVASSTSTTQARPRLCKILLTFPKSPTSTHVYTQSSKLRHDKRNLCRASGQGTLPPPTTTLFATPNPMYSDSDYDPEDYKILPKIPRAFGEDGGKFYKHYDDLAEEIDQDMVHSLKAQLDGILIFVCCANAFMRSHEFLTRS